MIELEVISSEEMKKCAFYKINLKLSNLLKSADISTYHKTPIFWRTILSNFSVVVYFTLSSINIYLILTKWTCWFSEILQNEILDFRHLMKYAHLQTTVCSDDACAHNCESSGSLPRLGSAKPKTVVARSSHS